MGFWDTAKRVGAGIQTGGLSELFRGNPFGIDNPLGNRGQNEFRVVDPQGNMANQAGRAAGFANIGEQGFIAGGEMLRGQLNKQLTGEQSLSAEQLRQGLQQNVAAQQSMAAGARGGNQAMAARTAMMQAGNLGAGLSGQQALAGIAERQAAAQALGQLRGQDLQAALGARGQALGGYGDIEAQRGQRFSALTGVPTQQEQILGALQGAAGLAMRGGAG